MSNNASRRVWSFSGGHNMIFRRLLLIALLVAAGFALATQAFHGAPVAKASQDSKTSTGFATGTVCKKSGTYRASNKYLENIIVVAEGEVFPPFSEDRKSTRLNSSHLVISY